MYTMETLPDDVVRHMLTWVGEPQFTGLVSLRWLALTDRKNMSTFHIHTREQLDYVCQASLMLRDVLVCRFGVPELVDAVHRCGLVDYAVLLSVYGNIEGLRTLEKRGLYDRLGSIECSQYADIAIRHGHPEITKMWRVSWRRAAQREGSSQRCFADPRTALPMAAIPYGDRYIRIQLNPTSAALLSMSDLVRSSKDK